MYLSVFGFLLGVVSIQIFPSLPPLYYLLPLIIFIAIVWYFLPKKFAKYFQCIAMAFIGCAWAVFCAQKILDWQLPEALEGKTVTVTGIVSSLPDSDKERTRFEFELQTLNEKPQKKTTLLISWYKYQGEPIKIGDQWTLKVRLKRPHGLANPGGFDYEKWLFQKKIRATGYVVNSAENKSVYSDNWTYPIDKFRAFLQTKMYRAFLDSRLRGNDIISTESLISALVIGIQKGISASQWEVMRATGTNHLMAIAGVHIGFVAGFIYAFIYFIWRRVPKLALYFPASQAAALAGFFTAILYAALAGFSLPAQRAIIMLFVFLVGFLMRRLLGVWNAFALALLLVLIWDPLATFSVSFWLSFGAVFIILYSMRGRLGVKGLWWKFGRMQAAITLGLIPICLILFQQTSLISFFANMFAVPAVGFLVLPPALLGTLCLLIYEPLGALLLVLSTNIMEIIWLVLSKMANFKWAVWNHAISEFWMICCCVCGILLLISPKGLPGRYLGFFGFLPLFYVSTTPLKSGEVEFVLLDVGQGLSAFIQTEHHTMIFDTGPRMSETEDSGNRVILPFLREKAISSLDKMMISHGDSDHIGGAFSILKEVPVKKILTSVPEKFSDGNISRCIAGEAWKVDDVNFEILHPPLNYVKKGNDNSCVLKITTGKISILLTGDIEKSTEKYLVTEAPDTLKATILVAPHHGSKTSSTNKFIQAVQPQYVLFPVGYKNRYHFPNPAVLKRYEVARSIPLETAREGAITFKLNRDGIVEVSGYRKQKKRFWRESRKWGGLALRNPPNRSLIGTCWWIMQC